MMRAAILPCVSAVTTTVRLAGMGMLKTLVVLQAFVVLLASFGATPVRAQNFEARYAIRSSGLFGGDVGEATVRFRKAPASFGIDLAFAPKGLARSLGVGPAQASASGASGAAGLVPTAASLSYSVRALSERRRFSFAAGAVSDVEIVKDKPGGFARDRRVLTYDPRGLPALHSIAPAEMKNVLDPLSAITLASLWPPSDARNCARRLRVYDGQRRFDLHLTPQGSETLTTPDGATAQAPVCAVRFAPLGGHSRDGDEFTPWMQGATIRVVLTPAPGGAWLVPAHIAFDASGTRGEARLIGLKAL